jgi:transposase insI
VGNVNILIRQYIPKGFNINNISTQYLAYIQNKNNRRPREKLKFKSPIFVFNKNLIKFALGT